MKKYFFFHLFNSLCGLRRLEHRDRQIQTGAHGFFFVSTGALFLAGTISTAEGKILSVSSFS